jgi:hypothetical protein
VVGVKNGRLDHYVVHRDGTTELIATRGSSARSTWGRRLQKAGFIGSLVSFVAGFVFQTEILLWFFFAGFLTVIAGTFLISRQDLETYLRNRTGSDEGWTQLPYKLGGWPARSSLQLEAVKELSNQGEGSANVRDREDGLVEVVTTRKGSRYTHLVDQDGGIVEEERGQIPANERWRRRIVWGGPLLFIASLMLFDWGVLVGLSGAAVVVLLLIAAGLFDARDRRRRAGEGWFRLQAEEPAGD